MVATIVDRRTVLAVFADQIALHPRLPAGRIGGGGLVKILTFHQMNGVCAPLQGVVADHRPHRAVLAQAAPQPTR